MQIKCCNVKIFHFLIIQGAGFRSPRRDNEVREKPLAINAFGPRHFNSGTSLIINSLLLYYTRQSLGTYSTLFGYILWLITKLCYIVIQYLFHHTMQFIYVLCKPTLESLCGNARDVSNDRRQKMELVVDFISLTIGYVFLYLVTIQLTMM